jgi:hypothetical protein
MINREAADAAMARISVGDTVTATFNEKRVAYLVLSKRSEYYGLICQSPTNRVSLGIACTDIYKQEVEAMRLPNPVAQTVSTPAPRGRPPSKKKTEPAEPATVPHSGFSPPGSSWVPPDAVEVQSPAPAPAGNVVSMTAKPAPAPIEKAEGNSDWIIDSLDSAISAFKNEMLVILQALDEGAPDGDNQPVSAPVPAVRTCGACMYVDLDAPEMSCTKFNSTPPLRFILEAEKACVAFADFPY